MATTWPSPCPDARTLNAAERQWRWLLLLAWPVALALAAWLLTQGPIPLCLFRYVTMLPCPLCGGTHFFAALAAGDVLAAWQANPGLVPLLLLAAMQTLVLAAEAALHRRLPRWQVPTKAWLAGVVLLLAAWGVRLMLLV